MKHKLRFVTAGRSPDRLLNLLFRPPGFIIASLLLFSAIATAQETPPTGDFPVGTGIQQDLQKYPNLFGAFDTTGFNTISQRADGYTKDLLQDYNLMAVNIRSKTEYIAHYTTAYYSKWEAEQDQEDQSRVGVKHIGGQPAYWNDGNDTVLCWSTKGLSQPACSLMFGPHYRQDKRYKRWLYDCYSGEGCLTYTPRFRMALDNHGGAVPNEDVCIIKVIFRYRVPGLNEHHDVPFIERTLKVGDFYTTGKFDDFYLHPNPLQGWYEYYPDFILPKDLPQIPGTPSSVNYIDWESYTGIQFCVDWLRTDTLCTLYIDYAEVYDNNGWNEYIDNPNRVDSLIINYTQSFPSSEWPNLINWFGVDEPYSIDCYIPIQVVDELIRSVQSPPLIIHFDPSWWHTLDINGEDEIAVFDSIAKPSKILLGVYPCSPDWSVIRPYDFEWLRFNFQRTSTHDSSFWFKPQTFGFRKGENSWCGWRKPKSPELTSMVMLALAHGTKGIIFEWFDSYELTGYSSCAPAYIECLVDSNGNPEVNDGDILYLTVKDKLAPRLKGTLGNKLYSLNYTLDYVQLRRNLQEIPGFDFYNTGPTDPTPI